MPASSTPPRQGPLQGTAVVLLAESIALPAGVLSAAYLTRHLGPEAYGHFSVVATLVTTLEWIMIAILARATVKFIAEAADWRPVAGAAFRAYLGFGALVGVSLFAVANPVAAALRGPELAGYFRLFAIEIPIFAVAMAFRNILAGLAHFRQQAVIGAGRWISRVTLIVLFVHLGFAVDGAILGSIGGVLVAGVLGQAFVGRSVWRHDGFPMREFWSLAAPVFLLTLSARLFDRLGLLALQVLGGSAAQTGYYGAAQNLLMLAGVVSMSVSPILISTVAASRQAGRHAQAKQVATVAIKAGLWLFPFAGIVAGASGEVVDLLFGRAFAPASPLVAWMIVTAVALIMISIASAIVIALGRPWPAVALTAPLLPLSLVGHMFLVPRLAALGAAVITASTAVLGAIVCLAVGCRLWPLRLPLGTLARSAMVTLAAYTAAAAWPASGPMLVIKIAVLSVGVVLVAGLAHELSWSDLDWLRLSSRQVPPDEQGTDDDAES